VSTHDGGGQSEQAGDLKKDCRKRDGWETLQKRKARWILLEKEGLWSDVNIREAFKCWRDLIRRPENGRRGCIVSAPYVSNIGFAVLLVYTLVYCMFIFCSFLLFVHHLHFIREVLFCFTSAMVKRHPLLHCMFVHFGDEAMKGGVCLFGVISNIKCFSEIAFCTFKGVMNWEINFSLNFWYIRGHHTIRISCNFQNWKLPCWSSKSFHWHQAQRMTLCHR